MRRCKRIRSGLTASELLPGLDEDTSKGTEANLGFVPLEAVGIRALADGTLMFQVVLDFAEFLGDFRVVWRETGKS